MFVAYRQFASAAGTKEIKALRVPLPSGAKTAADGTVVYPASVWTVGAQTELLSLPEYFASTCDIWSRNKGGLLKKLKPNKHFQVITYINGKRRPFLVHRIIASTFLSKIRHAGQEEVDHIDIDKGNHALANLRWASKAQNASNKCSKRKKATSERLRDLFSRAVQQLSIVDGSFIAEFPSLKSATEAMGCSKYCINACVLGKTQTSCGFAWRLSPPEMTLANFKDRGFDVVGGIAEAPHFFFSEDLWVYHNGIGKMYQIPIAHGHVYPQITIGNSLRPIHQVVAALREGYSSLQEYDEFCLKRLRNDGERCVVMHDILDDGTEDKEDFWNCKIGTQKDNMTGASGRAVEIRLSRDPTAELWKYDGTHDAVFSSCAEAGRVLAGYSDLQVLQNAIAQSARVGCSFSLRNGQRGWAFAA